MTAGGVKRWTDFEQAAKAQETGSFEINLNRLHSPEVILDLLDVDCPGYCHAFLIAWLFTGPSKVQLRSGHNMSKRRSL